MRKRKIKKMRKRMRKRRRMREYSESCVRNRDDRGKK